VDDDFSKLNRDLDPNKANPIHCCICLNGSEGRVPAITMIKGYAVCEKHVVVIRNHDFDFSALLQFGKKNAT
jgi:hypothetical protein